GRRASSFCHAGPAVTYARGAGEDYVAQERCASEALDGQQAACGARTRHPSLTRRVRCTSRASEHRRAANGGADVRKPSAVLLVLLSLAVLALWSLLPRGPGEAEAAARPTLRRGAAGEAVREVQQRLKDWGYYDGAVDGKFGPQTE